jgi:adenylosuccinate lyase
VILTKDEIKEYLSYEDVEEIMDPHTYIGSSKRIVDEILESSKNWF